MANTVKTLEEITALPLNTKLYKPGVEAIKWWYYGGINPMSTDSIILISAGSVLKMEGEYFGLGRTSEYFLDYTEACFQLLENAKANVEKVQRIFVDNKQ